MGLEVLFWIWVLTWMTKTAATDVLHAVKGTPNPRYELKRERALKAGQPVKGPARYGSREWAADLLSDALVANTEKRRKSAKAKAQPVDSMVDAVREPKPQPARGTSNAYGIYPERKPQEKPVSLIPDDWTIDRNSPTGKHLAGEWCGNPNCDCACKQCLARMTEPGRSLCDECLATPDITSTANQTLAQVIQFPNIKKIEKEISMSNPEATGLTTAIAFADAAADAHQTFSTAGSEGYAGALEQMGFGPGITSLAGEAREASGTATAKWTALSDAMKEFMQGREFYANNPDAPEKVALVNE